MPTPHSPITWTEIKNYIDEKYADLELKIDNVAITMPIGHIFVTPYVPVDCLICEGQTVSRTTYSALYEYLNKNDLMITDSQWNSTANSNNGYCAQFSIGDGNSTFRLPKFAPFIQIGDDGTVNDYHAAGLPNITGSIQIYGVDLSVPNGALLINSESSGYRGGDWNSHANGNVGFNASSSNSIYGRSSTVQPESNVWLVCVQA